ncbi:MAG: glycosyltransferase [Flavobacteriales bacterium]|nr:glycosyltransferase [Flavobacteriales bacterium]
MLQPVEPLLIISHTFPPYRGIGGRRWAKFAKELARRGHPVHVIHSAGGKDLLGSLWAADVEVPGIITHPLPQRYPTVLFKRPLKGILEKLAYHFWVRVLPLLVKGNWYDKSVFWEKQLLHTCRALIAAQDIRKVVVTGAPFRLMAYVAQLKEEMPELQLVADFRDPWTWSEVYGQAGLNAEAKAYERELEARVALTFDCLISPAPAIVEHLRHTYGGDPGRYVLIPHAIDPGELGAPAAPRNDGAFRMIYAGSLYGAHEADAYLDAVMNAFAHLRSAHPTHFHRTRFDLYITGHDVGRYRERVAARGLGEHIRFHAPLPPKEIFARIAAADLVVAFIPSFNKDFLGTKFNEVFYLRKPLLHVGELGLVGSTITERKLGASVTVAQLPEELPQIITSERAIEVDPHADLSSYLLANVTERLMQEAL